MKILPARLAGLGRHPVGHWWLTIRLIGAGMLIATGAIHLDLYVTGYRTIPTIGWLFLVQLITAFVLGALVLVTTSRLLSLMGAGFALATFAGYLLSLRIGLFGFREVRTSAGIIAGVIEVVSFAALAAFALRPMPVSQPFGSSGRISGPAALVQTAIPPARWVALVLVGAAGVLFGLSLASTRPNSTGASALSAVVRLRELHGVSVLTNASGFTLYWFVPDTATSSACYGTCADYWPPLTGSPSAGPGVGGTLGAIMRHGGTIQVTYARHPLYTYVGDSAPGQDNGNDINLNGGIWHEMVAGG